MKVNIKREVTITLEVSLREAVYLRGLTQNPLARAEPPEEEELRRGIFTPLNNEIQKLNHQETHE